MDLIDQRHLLKELQDQKYALDQSAIVGATDPRGRITYVNEMFCSISGYSRVELLGQTHRVISSGHHSQEFFRELWNTISAGKTWQGEICNRTKLGQLYWVQTTIVPFLNAEGRPYQYLSIRQDITALKVAEQTVREQQAKLVASSKLSALGELSAALTHEINNPLAVILGRAEMIQSQLASPTPSLPSVKQMIEAIQVTGKKIEKIMNTVRALSHGGDAEPLQQSTVRAVIDSALDIVGARLRDHGMTLLVSLRDGETKIECRPTEVFQILVNLLSNAHDAVGEMEEKKIWISSELDREGQGVLIRVMDSGPGIPVDIRKKLFSPFFTTKQIGVGTGLGLTISSGLATRNGAKLWLDEQHPKTCFCLWLPLRGPHFALHS